MTQLVEIDRHVSLFEQMEEQAGPVLLINTFTVELEEADRLQGYSASAWTELGSQAQGPLAAPGSPSARRTP